MWMSPLFPCRSIFFSTLPKNPFNLPWISQFFLETSGRPGSAGSPGGGRWPGGPLPLAPLEGEAGGEWEPAAGRFAALWRG